MVEPGKCVNCGQPVSGVCDNPNCGMAQAGKRGRERR